MGLGMSLRCSEFLLVRFKRGWLKSTIWWKLREWENGEDGLAFLYIFYGILWNIEILVVNNTLITQIFL